MLPQILDAVHAYRADFNVVAAFVLGAFFALMLCTKFGRRLLTRAFRALTGARLRFDAYERSTVWFGVIADQRYIVSLKAVWKVTNPSKHSVTLKGFCVNGLATEHHMLSVNGSHDTEALIPPRGCADLEIFCMVQKTLTWGSGVFSADVSLIDDHGDVRSIKNVRFKYLKQSNLDSQPTPPAIHSSETAEIESRPSSRRLTEVDG
jgi:hypothetical protein